eukprot:CAMPEP_0178428014 /NCGR_PEP_ID=MMETSP0689_2-20121128/30050_1 /TAXON_ID=160604 /ORGANISM="Amphidinium massartii, Strain CS-259" /LENGTH=349 /DNA_ID=CAMNT_0020049755 /DNA_START=45 /DNA_END=1094 /DNA_ORIENTATION=+
MKISWWFVALLSAGSGQHFVSGLVAQRTEMVNSGPAKSKDAAALVSPSFLQGHSNMTEAHRSPMPTITHQKEPGNGYIPGSPLYEKQQALQAGTATVAPSSGSAACSPQSGTYAWCVLANHPVAYLTSVAVHILLILLFAYLYKTYKSSFYVPAKSFSAREDHWAYHLFSIQDLRQDLCLCCMSWCCLGIRWADTVSSWKVMPGTFWTAIVTLIILEILAPLTGGLSMLIMFVIFVYMRQRIRGVFGHARGNCYTLSVDCLAWCCCPCCSTVQEAREVEKVMLPSTAGAPQQHVFAPPTQGPPGAPMPGSIATLPPSGSPSSGHYPTLPQDPRSRGGSGVQPFASMSSQ